MSSCPGAKIRALADGIDSSSEPGVEVTAPGNPSRGFHVVVDVSDLSPIRGKSRGIYNYAHHLLKAMVPLLPEGWTLTILCNGDSYQDFSSLGSRRVDVRLAYDRYPPTVLRVLWALGLGAWRARALAADVYFCPKGFAPRFLHRLGRVGRVVVTVHDLIPLWYAKHFPMAVGRLERAFVNNWLVWSIQTADRIIAVSQATARDVADQLARRKDVSVVPNGVPPLPEANRRGVGNYIFAMASTLPHKNLKGILGAYERYRSLTTQPLPLTVCGVTGEWGEGVTAVANVTPLELSNLYASARVFIFLPFIEGFGFPVLESLLHGTPVICSDIPALRESSGGNATFVGPDDLDGCARQILSAADRPVRLGSTWVSVPDGASWSTCAQRTLVSLGA